MEQIWRNVFKHCLHEADRVIDSTRGTVYPRNVGLFLKCLQSHLPGETMSFDGTQLTVQDVMFDPRTYDLSEQSYRTGSKFVDWMNRVQIRLELFDKKDYEELVRFASLKNPTVNVYAVTIYTFIATWTALALWKKKSRLF